MHKGFSKTEDGTRISLHICDICGTEFSINPAQNEDDNCGQYDCESYDPDKDVGPDEPYEAAKLDYKH